MKVKRLRRASWGWRGCEDKAEALREKDGDSMRSALRCYMAAKVEGQLGGETLKGLGGALEEAGKAFQGMH